MVECQLEGTMVWLRGTVVNVHLEQALYDVALEPVRGPMPLRRSVALECTIRFGKSCRIDYTQRRAHVKKQATRYRQIYHGT